MQKVDCLMLTAREVEEAWARSVAEDYLKDPERLVSDIVAGEVPAQSFGYLDDYVSAVQVLQKEGRLPEAWRAAPVLLVRVNRDLAVAVYEEVLS